MTAEPGPPPEPAVGAPSPTAPTSRYEVDPYRPDVQRTWLTKALTYGIGGTILLGVALGYKDWDHTRELWEIFVPGEFALLAAIGTNLFSGRD